VERVVRKFGSFEEADAADRDFYRRITPDERIAIMVDLISPKEPMKLPRDLREFVDY